MAQLDKLLIHILPKGAEALRLEANKPPMLHMPSGIQSPLLANPVPATMLELLAREVVPAAELASWQTTGEAAFDYITGSQTFRIQLGRTPLGTFIQAAPVTESIPVTQASVPPPAPAPAPLPSPTPAKTQPECGTHPLAERLFQALLNHKGSDLHCSSFEAPIIRVDGDMEDLMDFGILSPTQLLEMMEAVAPGPAWQRFMDLNDTDFAYPFKSGNCRLRVNYFMDRVGPGLVCRVIPNEIPDPDRLGLPEHIRNLADLAKGLVLVTGPTGSGKSTTLAAIIDLVNQRRRDHILTIEDPIEFVHPRKNCLVNQREVGTHTESFKSGLRAALREDPDVVLVGEMRDLETIAIALETAITGHLVFGTLHTNSAIGTIDRIVDQFPADRQQQIRIMLADCLKACISQSLLKKRTGGRVAAIESLFITPAIASLIRDGKTFQIVSAMQTGRAYGQKLMNDALVDLIHSNTIDTAEAYMKCPDKESFIATLKRNNINWDPRGGE
ncbi:type IV pilus twitching motility protein PilT [Holophaga foetida]|uniref:type IV pilus twitching motility protein PilT n=1 Tax=Holophaga foetida TaxID=35839 RepID=UPI000247499C|nr:PilT/PilU family type 4a pilus ATPase [Holophaga foetida]